MKKLKEEELLNIKGGVSVSATVINAFARAGQLLYDLGRSLGTAIRMIGKKKAC